MFEELFDNTADRYKEGDLTLDELELEQYSENLKKSDVDESNLLDASTPLIHSSEVTYPFMYLYPFSFECELERLKSITEEDDSLESDKLNVVVNLDDNLISVGRFKFNFKNVFKLLAFKKYKIVLVKSENDSCEVDPIDLIQIVF